MKTLRLSALLAGFLILLQACNHDTPLLPNGQTDFLQEQITVEEARLIFDSYQNSTKNARTNAKKFEKKPQWDFAQKEKFTDGREAVIVSLSTDVTDYDYMVASVNDISRKPKTAPEVFTTHKLVVYKDKGKDKMEIMSVIGEEKYKTKYTYFDYDNEFTGMVNFSSMDGDFIRGFYYDKGKRIGIVQEPSKNTKNGKINACYIIQSLYVFYYYTTAGGIQYPSQPNGDVRLVYHVVCDDAPAGIYLSPNTYNSGGGASVSSASAWMANLYQQQAMFNQLFDFKTDDLPINADDHLRCFSNMPSTCTVTLNIDQPVDGTNWALNTNLFAKHRVGHAFLTFQQVLPNGVVYRASIGFYPDGGGTPYQPSGGPKFVDDGNYSTTPDVRVTFDVSPSEMMTMVNHVKSYNNGNYNLINRNCGNMCVDAFAQIGVGLPTGWMNTFWYNSTQVGSSYNSEVRGPSIGAFGEQMKGYSNSKITNTNSATSKSGNCN